MSNPYHIALVVGAAVAALQADPDFGHIATVHTNADPGVWLKTGEDVHCFVCAQDNLGNFSCVTQEGYVRQYLASEVD